jgi:DNA-binding MarR family transcriptional regulator
MSICSCSAQHDTFDGMAGWNLLSNHGLALLCIARDHTIRMRDIGDQVGVTERAAHRLVADLVAAGVVTREREGNRNRYTVVPDAPMGHPLLQKHWIGEILAVLADRPWPAEPPPQPPPRDRRKADRRGESRDAV